MLTILIYIAIIGAVVTVDQVTKVLLLHSDFTYIPHLLYNNKKWWGGIFYNGR